MGSEWWERGYPGGPMVAVKGFPRPLYPPDAPDQAASVDGPDVEAYKRTVSRAGRWEWQAFDQTYSNGFAHGKTGGAVGESGIAGVQRQQGISATGNLGRTTFDTLRSIRIPDGLPHAGEPAMDARAVELIAQAFDRFGGSSSSSRHRLSPNFTVEEFDCHDGTPVPERDYAGLERLCATYLEPLRDKYGTVTINSGFRTPAWNAEVGGASESFHVYTEHDGNDQAADVVCAKGSPSDWHAFLNGIRQNKCGGNGGLGLYSTFCHVDMRDYPSSWKG